MPGPTANPWPTQTDYQDALQDPRRAFAGGGDPELAAATVADVTPFGLPSPVTGQYANIYRMRLADGRLAAVRLFLRDLEGREATYRALQAHAAALPIALPFLVPFLYEPEGITVRGRRCPLVRMEWVEGVPLNVYVNDAVAEPERLADLTRRWADLVRLLETARIAHGDLQHGNVLVEPATGALRLLDYDGVWVPELAGKVSGRETGHPAYQHPKRTAGDYGPLMDRFSALVIHTALFVVSRSPDLWYRLDNGDNLLFSRDDLADPDASKAFFLLSRSTDGAVRRAGRALEQVCRVPLYLVPDLERFAAGL
jgi:hypothetical protein